MCGLKVYRLLVKPDLLRVLFWGTPSYAIPSLDALFQAGYQIVGVVTQPDRRRARGGALLPSAVKQRAMELEIPIFCPERIRNELHTQANLAALNADLNIVVAFGQLLPETVLYAPTYGSWNGHGSLLPRWRGAAPIQWSLIEGDHSTGVGIMAMELGLDTGPVLIERAITIGFLENANQLAERLSVLTAELFLEAIPLITTTNYQLKSQALEGICKARLITKNDYEINWQQPALQIHRQVMGLFPGAHTKWQGKRLKFLATEPLVERLQAELSPEVAELTKRRWPKETPGAVLDQIANLGIVFATGGCPLLLRSGQLEGKTVASGANLIQQLS
jgi:methionyl-tRNA formyltransferase